MSFNINTDFNIHHPFSNPSVPSPTSQFILQPLFRFSYVTNSWLNSLCSFSNFSVTSPTSQLIFQPFRRFTYVTPHSPTLLLLHLRHTSFSNPCFASPMSQTLYLIHCSFSNISVTSHTSQLILQPSLALPTSQFIIHPSLALPTSQLIRQPFRCFTYATAHSPTLLSLLLRHRIFTYVTWRATHASGTMTLSFVHLWNRIINCYNLGGSPGELSEELVT